MFKSLAISKVTRPNKDTKLGNLRGLIGFLSNKRSNKWKLCSLPLQGGEGKGYSRINSYKGSNKGTHDFERGQLHYLVFSVISLAGFLDVCPLKVLGLGRNVLLIESRQ